MTSCECKDEWVYYPTQFGGNQGMTMKGCDPIAPDFNGTTWCYLKGGEAAASCPGATKTSGNVYGDQLYWAECNTSSEDLAKIADKAKNLDLSKACETFSGDKALCETKTNQILQNCADCLSDPTQAKCSLNTQDLSWNPKMSGKLGNKTSCQVLGSYFTNSTE